MKKIVALLFAGLLASPFAFADNTSTTTTDTTAHHRTEHHAEKKADETSVVNINSADAKTLTQLRDIGAKKAADIVAYRDQHGAFKSVDDLQNVPGIGAKRMAKMKADNGARLTLGN